MKCSISICDSRGTGTYIGTEELAALTHALTAAIEGHGYIHMLLMIMTNVSHIYDDGLIS